MRYMVLFWLLTLSSGLSSQQLAYAQSAVTVYDVVDQLPQLPAGGGTEALAEALTRNFHYPAGVQSSQVNGMLHLEVVVTQTGKIATIELDRSSGSKGIPASIDEAIRTTLRKLPTLVPARLAGRPVAAKMYIIWSFARSFYDKDTHMRVTIEQLQKDTPELSSFGEDEQYSSEDPLLERTYTYVEQMPSLPTGGGQLAVIKAVQQALVVPAHAQQGVVFVSFVVDKQGQVSEPTIAKGLDASTDAAVLEAVRRLPTFIPGRQHKQPARVSLTLPITVSTTSRQQPVRR